MALPSVVPQSEVGGRSPRRQICAAAAVLVVLAHTCTAIDTNGQAMRMVRRCESPGDGNGQAMQMAMRILMKELLANLYATLQRTCMHIAQFSNQQTHGQMNNKTGGRFCSHKSCGPLSASSCDKEWGRGAKPPKNFWGPAAAAAHLDPHLLMNTNMPRRDFTCRSR